MDQTYSKNILIRTSILIMQINIQYNHFKDDKSTPLVEQWWRQNREDDQPKVVTPKPNRTQLGQTNPTKTTKHKQILNNITKSVKANKNGRETKKWKLQSKHTFKSKMESFKETLSTLQTRGSEMEYNEEAMEVEKWGRRRRNSDRERARAVQKKKSEVKFRAGGKIEAPCRFWPPNWRGACPEIKKIHC